MLVVVIQALGIPVGLQRPLTGTGESGEVNK